MTTECVLCQMGNPYLSWIGAGVILFVAFGIIYLMRRYIPNCCMDDCC